MKSSLTIRQWVNHWCRRFLKWFIWGLLVYALILLVGLLPTNNDFRPVDNGVEIYLVSNAVHADIIVPKSNPVMDWSERFSSDEVSDSIEDASFVAFGWGDKGFYLETETWDDFKLSTAANALFLPSPCCVHVSFTDPNRYSDVVSVRVSQQQYERLVEYIDSTFQTDDQHRYVCIPGYSYSSNDAFYCAHGNYHFLNTCNSWVGRGLQAAGVKTPWLSPLPKTPMLYIEN